jgi:hypothetical protein
LIPGRPLKVNTFAEHRWSIRQNNRVLYSWTIDQHKKSQRFVLSLADIVDSTLFMGRR